MMSALSIVFIYSCLCLSKLANPLPLQSETPQRELDESLVQYDFILEDAVAGQSPSNSNADDDDDDDDDTDDDATMRAPRDGFKGLGLAEMASEGTRKKRSIEEEEEEEKKRSFSFSAITTASDGRIYGFRGTYVYILEHPENCTSGSSEPLPIGVIFPDGPSSVDAAATLKGLPFTYLYSGDQEYKYRHWKSANLFILREKRSISSAWWRGNMPEYFTSRLSAAMSMDRGRHMVKKNQYWEDGSVWRNGTARFYKVSEGCDENAIIDPCIDNNACVWPGVPLGATEAILSSPDGSHYFFTGWGEYYRWNATTRAIEDATPPYPRKINEWWLNCKK